MIKISCLLVGLLMASSTAFAGDPEDEIAAAFATMKAESYAAKQFTKVMPYEVGQWVLYGQTDDDDERSLMKMSIVGKEGGAWILESWMLTEDGVVITQFHVKGFEKAATTGSVDDIEFTKIRLKSGDSDPMTIEGFVLDLSSGVYKDAMKGWFQQSTDFSPGGPAMVPAGTFAGTTKASSEVVIFGDEVEGTGWLHPDVPIYGMVKSTNDDGYSMVLLDFGTSGAKASF